MVFKFHGNIQIFLNIFELVVQVRAEHFFPQIFFFGFQEHGHQGYLDDFRRKKQLICHRHVDDLRNEKKLIQYVGRETDSLIQNWLIPTEYHLRCNCAKQSEFIMYPSVIL